MTRATILKRLRAHRAELNGLGVEGLSLFGSVARGQAGVASDVDLATRLDGSKARDLFDLSVIHGRLSEIVGRPIDMVSEPARKATLQAEIDRDRVRVF
jgi:uncharacterized protein